MMRIGPAPSARAASTIELLLDHEHGAAHHAREARHLRDGDGDHDVDEPDAEHRRRRGSPARPPGSRAARRWRASRWRRCARPHSRARCRWRCRRSGRAATWRADGERIAPAPDDAREDVAPVQIEAEPDRCASGAAEPRADIRLGRVEGRDLRREHRADDDGQADDSKAPQRAGMPEKRCGSARSRRGADVARRSGARQSGPRRSCGARRRWMRGSITP